MPIETFFTPSHPRLRPPLPEEMNAINEREQLLEQARGESRPRRPRTEVRLQAERAEEFWSTTHAWKDLEALVKRHMLVWVTEDEFLIDDHWQYDPVFENVDAEDFDVKSSFAFSVCYDESKSSFWNASSVTVGSLSDQEPTQVYQMIIDSMAEEPCYSVAVRDTTARDVLFEVEPLELSLSEEVLSHFLRVGQIHGHATFFGAEFSQEQCEVLATFRFTMRFSACGFEDDGQFFFDEIIAGGRGPTKLEIDFFRFNAQHLYSALVETATLSALKVEVPCWDSGTDERFSEAELAEALGQNKSLTKFEFGSESHNVWFPEDCWDAFFLALRHHPTLESVAFWIVPGHDTTTAALERRARVMADMLKVNENICVLDVFTNPDNFEDELEAYLTGYYHYDREALQEDFGEEQLLYAAASFIRDQEIFRTQIRPRLRANTIRRNLLDLSKDDASRPIRSVLFNATLENPVVHYDPSSVWAWMSAFREELVAQLDEHTRKRAESVSKKEKMMDKKETAVPSLSDM